MMKNLVSIFVLFIITLNLITITAISSNDLKYRGEYADSGYSVFDIKYTFGSENKNKYIYFNTANKFDDTSKQYFWLSFNNKDGTLGYSPNGKVSNIEKICDLELNREYRITAIYNHTGGINNSSFKIYIDGVQCGGDYICTFAENDEYYCSSYAYTLTAEGGNFVYSYIPWEVSAFSAMSNEATLDIDRTQINAVLDFSNSDDMILKLRGNYSLKNLKESLGEYNLIAVRNGYELSDSDILQNNDKLIVRYSNNTTQSYKIQTEKSISTITFEKETDFIKVSTNMSDSGYILYLAQYIENELVGISIDNSFSDGYTASITCIDNAIIKAFLWKNDMTPLYSEIYSE